MKILFLVCLAAGTVILALCYTFEALKYAQTGAKKFNILNTFPFEINSFSRFNRNTYFLFILEIIGSLLLVLPSLFFALSTVSSNTVNIVSQNVSAYLLFAFFTLDILVFNILRFVKLTNYTTHLVFDSLLIMFNLFIILTEFIFFTNSDYQFVMQNDTVQRISLIVVTIILLIAQFALMVNPKYKDWAMLVKVDAETTSRPKVCYLAVLEWGSFIVTILSYIPILIVLFF